MASEILISLIPPEEYADLIDEKVRKQFGSRSDFCVLPLLEVGIPSPDPELEASVAIQAVVIAELRAANAEQARLIVTL